MPRLPVTAAADLACLLAYTPPEVRRANWAYRSRDGQPHHFERSQWKLWLRVECDRRKWNLLGTAECGNSQACVVQIPSVGIVVAVRGTELDETADVWDDLQVRLVPLDATRPGVRVHTGFLAHANRIQDQIVRLLRGFTGDVYLVGHSMGGAVACILAVAIAEITHRKVAGVFTVGCPAPGNAAFAQLVEESSCVIRRVIYKADSVAHLPPCGMMHQYVCPGTIWYCSRSGAWWAGPQVKGWRRYIDRALIRVDAALDYMVGFHKGALVVVCLPLTILLFVWHVVGEIISRGGSVGVVGHNRFLVREAIRDLPIHTVD